MNYINKALALTIPLLGIVAVTSPAQLPADFVVVNYAGNANDSTGFGAVSYTYGISKFEITMNQYITFLNAVAKTDTYGLYNANIGTDRNVGRIARTGSSGSYVYAMNAADAAFGNRPISYVSWFDAARYANWLQNGQPVGLQAAGTTETGSYTLNGATSGVGFARTANAIYALPSENEWYKAAYYQPASQGGDVDDYWLYPTRNNSIPNSLNGSVSDPNSANFLYDDGIANGMNGGYAVTQTPVYSTTQLYLTPVGAFTQASSFFGTFDQGGNVREWTEGVSASSRIMRGGSWNGNDGNLRSLNRNLSLPFAEVESTGFRIVFVPEPSTAGLLALGMALLAWKRKQNH